MYEGHIGRVEAPLLSSRSDIDDRLDQWEAVAAASLWDRVINQPLALSAVVGFASLLAWPAVFALVRLIAE